MDTHQAQIRRSEEVEAGDQPVVGDKGASPGERPQSPGASATTYRTDIDGLRAVAVLLVLLMHADLGFSGGYIGVDVFFVISGFLITGIIKSGLESGKFSFANFWRRRISRITPAASATVLACVLAGALILVPPDLSDLASSGVAQQVLLANVYFSARVGYFDGPAELKPLLHMWSLAIEEQFYLVFPFILVGLFRWSRRTLPFAIITLGIVSLLYSAYALVHDPSSAFFLLPSRSWELLLGAILNWVPAIRWRHRVFAEAIALVGVSCILVPAVIYSGTTPFPGPAAIPPCLGTALLLLVGRTHESLVGRALSLRPMVFIGLISYSLYLVHWPMLVYLRYELGNELPLSIRLAVVLISIAIATLSWWGIEDPVRKFGTRQSIGRLMAGFTVVTLLLTGGLLWVRMSDGLPDRLSPEARAILDTPPVDDSVMRSTEEIQRDELPRFGSCRKEVDCLVWGDSHAASIAGAIDPLSKSLDICCTLATRAGTAPLLEAWREGKEKETTEWNQAVLDYACRNEVRVVVLMSRWSVNVEGQSSWNKSTLIFDAEEPDGDSDTSVHVLARGLRRTVDALRECGAQVVVVSQLPEHQIDARRILIKEIEAREPSPLSTTRAAHDARQRRVMSALEAIRGHDGVTVIDPTERLFTDSSPGAKVILGDADGAYYVDTNHPSRHGAILVFEPLLTEAVRHALEGPQD